MIAVHDEIDLPFGALKVKIGGSTAGHNGLKSLQQALRTPDFVRVRVGVGRPPGRQDPADYVLQPFAKREEADVAILVDAAADAVVSLHRRRPRRDAGQAQPLRRPRLRATRCGRSMTMERAEQRRTIDLAEVRRLMAHATGDEKHDESSTSTLDALAVLYGASSAWIRRTRELARPRPVHPQQGARADGVLRDPRAPRLLPRSVARRLHGLGRQAREPSRPGARARRRGVDRLARSRSPDVGRRRARAPRRRPHRAPRGRPHRRRRAERGLELGGDPARAGAAPDQPHAARDRQPQQQRCPWRRGRRSSTRSAGSRASSTGTITVRCDDALTTRDELRPTAVVADIPEGEW